MVYIPVSIRGGINNELQVDKLFNIGADRVILTNQLLSNENNIIEKIAEKYGNQSLVGKIDVRNSINNDILYTAMMEIEKLNQQIYL